MEAGMAAQIAQLRTFSRQQLLDMWQKLYDRAAPNRLTHVYYICKDIYKYYH